VTAGAGAGVVTDGAGVGLTVTAGAADDGVVELCDPDWQPASSNAAAARMHMFKLVKDNFVVFIVGFIG
jgi:hypothetical protein